MNCKFEVIILEKDSKMGNNKIEQEFQNRSQREAVRINKFLSEAGICSRREADRLIAAGQIKVDGIRAELGTKVGPDQEVRMGKRIIREKPRLIVLAVNKPAGIVCTEERRERKSIIRFLNYPARITYVGRLDKDSEGLLLMTNNGDIINKMMRAGNYHEKEYKVTVDKEITEEFLTAMRTGVAILDTVTRPCEVEQIGKYKFRIVLTQGLNRQIRRMCEVLGCQVRSLRRIRIMNIRLGDLKEGQYRELTDQELNELYELIKLSSNKTVIDGETD